MERHPQSGAIPREIRGVTTPWTLLLLFIPLLFHLIQVVGWARGFKGAFARPADLRSRIPEAQERPVRITVVLPVRNEVDTLPRLLDDLSHGVVQPYEVIVVDDDSEDGTAEAVTSGAELPFGIRVLANPGQGKKAGLSAGIRAAGTEWIVQVDGDVRVGPGFLSGITGHLERQGQNLDMMLLPLRLAKSAQGIPRRTFDLLQGLDFAAMQGWAVAAVNRGRPAMASGGAWVWRTAAFPHDRLRPDIASGDDVFSLAALIERGDGHRVGWCGDIAAMASAAPMPDLSSLLDQRIRWGAKATAYPKALAEARRVAMVIAAVHAAGLALLILDPPTGMLFWAAKAIIDMAYTHQVGRAYGLLSGMSAGRRALHLLLLALVHPPFIITTLLLMPIRSARWKGRSGS